MGQNGVAKKEPLLTANFFVDIARFPHRFCLDFGGYFSEFSFLFYRQKPRGKKERFFIFFYRFLHQSFFRNFR